ncbi:ATP-binding cassette domain-containing protein [Niallia taxi]|nr:ATP-binding cassette domain-containing protein [Niallia taxi]
MYAHYMQKSNLDCGIASLRTILAQLEIKISSVSELYKNYDIKKDQGLSLGELNVVLHKYGVITSAYEVSDFEELKRVSIFPMVLVVENDGYSHYVVVHEIEGSTFVVSNPAEPKLMTYDEEFIKSIFLGYALCVDKIEKISKVSSSNKNVASNTMNKQSTGEILYKEVINELPLKLKMNMGILLFLKYMAPILTTFIIQIFMQSITKYSSLLDILVPVVLVSWLIVIFFAINVKEGKQKVQIENKIQEKTLINYYNFKINEIDTGKNAENIIGYFWNLIFSVSGLFQRFYFKINVTYVMVLTIVLAKISLIMAITLIVWTTIYAIYLKHNIKKIRNNELSNIGKSASFSASIESTIKSSLDINLFSKNKQSEKFVREKMNNFLKARLASIETELHISSVYQSFITIMSLSAFVILGLTIMFGEGASLVNSTNGIFIISIILSSLSPVLQSWLTYQKSTVAIDYIQSSNDYINIKEKAKKRKIGVGKIRNIKINNLAFSYDETNELFNGFNMDISAGKIYGIKGENGTGKSTFIKLLAGILEPNKGEFVINQNIKEISLKDLNINEYISMYSPEFNLFGNTVGRNIRYKVFNENLEMAEKQHYNDIFNLKLPNNYMLQMDGVNISQGQKQKILLMRTLNEDKSIYIFDEPTGNLDSNSKKILIKEFVKLAKKENKIVILISHENEVLDCSDSIITMDKYKKR